jgi:glutamate---cysteine ligase / carboxylate-amine ligase
VREPEHPAGVLSTPAALRAAFETPAPMTVGLEEELMLLDADDLDLAPRAAEVLARDAHPGPAVARAELPAAQLELVGAPAATVGAAAAALLEARCALADAAAGIGVLAGAGAHPFAAGDGELTRGARYDGLAAEYGPVARRQLVFGLHVHVAVRGADRALAVYNALRSHLPLLAALGANAPYYEGADTGLASVRPKLSELLPRQGVPPAFASWEQLAGALAWGRAAGRVPDPAQWWWEARLHPRMGTVEVRVPDTQATVADAAALAAVVHALVGHLAERCAAGDDIRADETWRIAENRWSACRHGLEGTMADLRTGAVAPTRDRVHALLDELAGAAQALGCRRELDAARALADAGGGAAAQRSAGGARAAAALLARRFLEAPGPGALGATQTG